MKQEKKGNSFKAGMLSFLCAFAIIAMACGISVDSASAKTTKVATSTDAAKEIAKATKLVKKLKFASANYNVALGGNITLSPVTTPKTAAKVQLVWKSSNKAIASVSTKGVVKGKKCGKVTITCSVKGKSKVKTTCKVTVTPAVQKVKVSVKKSTLKLGASIKLKATVTGPKTSYKGVVWTSSNPKVATVSSKGVVKALTAGKTRVTCTAADGSKKKATCLVTVKPYVNKVKVSTGKVTLKKGKKVQLKTSLKTNGKLKTSLNKKYTKVTWKSSNNKVATVSSKGVVKAVKKGTAIITCTAVDGSKKKATCKVTVKSPKTL